MNSANEFPLDTQAEPPAPMSETRPLYWSVKRELWENRSVYVAPAAVAFILLFAFLVSTIGLPHRRRALLMQDEGKQRAAISEAYHMATGMVVATAFLVGVFYCLDALYGERRDRSILFWKSLPVSDRTTVLSKAAIPLVVMPAFCFAIIVVTQTVMAVSTTTILLGSGMSPATIWPQFRFLPSPLLLIYTLPVIALWHAPIYAWLLLVSCWAKRAAFLWAIFPFLAAAAFEAGAFHTAYIAKFLGYRVIGWMTAAFVEHSKNSAPLDPLQSITPLKFLLTPGLWLGLVFAALVLAATVRMRRNREPI